MRELLASADVEKISLTTVRLLDVSSRRQKKGFDERAATLLRRAQQRHPADFLINRNLAVLLATAEPPQLEEAIGYFRVAVAVRPQSPGVHVDLGFALKAKGRLDEAIAECREALQLKKDYAEAHSNVGNALADKGQLDEAIAQYREAIRLKKDDAITTPPAPPHSPAAARARMQTSSIPKNAFACDTKPSIGCGPI